MTSKNSNRESEKTSTRGMSPRVAPPKPEGLTKPPPGISTEVKPAGRAPTQDPSAENS